MTVIGSGYVRLMPDATGFAESAKAELQPELDAISASTAESAGLAGKTSGSEMGAGLAAGLGAAEGDVAKAGEDLAGSAGGGLSKFTTDATKAGDEAGKELSGGFSKGTGLIGSLLGGLGVPLEGFSSSVEKVGGQLEKGEGSAGGFAGALSAIPTPIAVVGAAVLGVGVVAAKMGIEFDEATAKIAAAGGISQSAAANIGQAFLSTAGTVTFGAQAIAQSFGTVVGQLNTLNGGALTAAQSLDVMKASMDLAEASGSSLNSAAADVTTTLQSFKLGVSDAGFVTDNLYNVSTKTGTSIDGVTKAFQKIHSSLGAASPDIATLSGLIGDMAKNGVAGKSALSGLTAGLTALTSPTTAQLAAQKALGVSFQDQYGNFIGTEGAINELKPKLAGLTSTQQQALIATITSTKAAAAWTGVIDGGSTALDKNIDAMAKSGSAQKAAGKATDTFSGAWAKVKAGVGDALTELGTKLAPTLTKMGQDLAAAVAWVTAHWPQISKVMGQVFTDVKKFIAPFVTQIKGIVTILQGLIQFVTDVFEGKWEGAWQGIKKVFDGVVEFIKGRVQEFLAPFMLLAPALDKVWGDIKSGVTTAWDDIVGFFTGIPAKIGAALSGVLAIIGGAFTGAAQWVDTNVINPVVAFFTGLPGKILSGLSGIVNTIWGAFTGAAQWVSTNVIEPTVGFFAALPGRILTGLAGIVGTIWSGLVGAADWVYNNVISPVVTSFTKMPGTIASDLSGFIGDIFKDIGDVGSWVEKNIVQPVVKAIQSIPSKIGSLGGKILGDLTGGISGAASKLFSFLAEGGIVTSPTLSVIGEAGPEAVIPLNDTARALDILGLPAPGTVQSSLPSASSASASSAGGAGPGAAANYLQQMVQVAQQQVQLLNELIQAQKAGTTLTLQGPLPGSNAIQTLATGIAR